NGCIEFARVSKCRPKSDVCCRKIGAETQSCPVFGYGVRHGILQLKQLAKIVVGGRRIGLQFHSSAGMCQGLGPSPFLSEHPSLILMRFGESGIDPQRFLEMRSRPWEVFSVGKQVSQVVVRLGIIRSGPDSGFVVPDRASYILLPGQMVGVRIMGFR